MLLERGARMEVKDKVNDWEYIMTMMLSVDEIDGIYATVMILIIPSNK